MNALLSSYLPIVLFIGVALVVGLALIVAPFLVAYRNPDPEKLSAYEDAAQIGSYARNALAWAVDAGLIQGTSPVTLNPRGNATRAQTAVIITRYLSNAKEGA